jgi:hypothetical protein
MKILQISTTRGQDCGISLFADNLQTHLRRVGLDITTVAALQPDTRADIVLLQHHNELMSDCEVIALVKTSHVPVVIFAHSEGINGLYGHVDGIVAMCPGIIGPTDKPTYVFPHPAWVPTHLESRNNLRREFSLPLDRLIVGTNGFLKFDRQFTDIVEGLLPEAHRRNWFIEIITSPWRLASPGLITKLEILQARNLEHFRFEHAFLDRVNLNRRLQACDLLWCWTAAPSSSYASGVISDQYASGTRVFAADKQQHRHILGLPNTITAPDTLAPFVDQLVIELCNGELQRHDPTPVSWDNSIKDLADFIQKMAA